MFVSKRTFNPFLHIHVYTFIAWVNNVDTDQPAHPYRLNRIYNVCFLIHSVISDQNATSADPDQTARMQADLDLHWLYMCKNAYIRRKGLKYPCKQRNLQKTMYEHMID
jgi:hypothetical protein